MRFNLSLTEVIVLGTIFSGIAGWGFTVESRAHGIDEEIDARVEAAVRKAVPAAITELLPLGTVVAWHRTADSADLPKGWAICNGNNGTPDLRGRFLRGEHPDVDTTGGRLSHVIEDLSIEVYGTGWVNDPVRRHPVGGPYRNQGWGNGQWHPLISEGDIPGQEIDLVPPYHEVIFIIKVE